MKKLSILLVLLSLAAILLPTGVTVAHTEDEPLSVDLLVRGFTNIGGVNVWRTTDIGDVNVWNDRENLYVNYVSSTDACFQETHLAVVTDLADIPRTRWGRALPDQFEYSDPHGCVQEYTYTINLAEKGWTVDTLLYIAAHAATRTETAWGDGARIVRDRCGRYFTYTVQPVECTPRTVCADFGSVPNEPHDDCTGAYGAVRTTSVEGLGRVHEYLNIDAVGTACKIEAGQPPAAYGGQHPLCDPDHTFLANARLESGGGFSDLPSRNAGDPHEYTFTFAPGITVSEFRLHMLDFGDWNPTRSEDHYASMIAYDADGNEVSRHELTYNSEGKLSPTRSDYGDLWCQTGDSVYAGERPPGNWTWHVEGSGIVRVELVFGTGHDPQVGFDSLCITIEECPN